MPPHALLLGLLLASGGRAAFDPGSRVADAALYSMAGTGSGGGTAAGSSSVISSQPSLYSSDVSNWDTSWGVGLDDAESWQRQTLTAPGGAGTASGSDSEAGNVPYSGTASDVSELRATGADGSTDDSVTTAYSNYGGADSFADASSWQTVYNSDGTS